MIKFKNINLKFDNKTVFKNMNFDTKTGEKLVIIGNSGVGKSTIFNLILGFIKPNAGKIYINNLEVNVKNIAQIRNMISYVPQNVNIPFDKAYEFFNSQFLYSKIELPNQEKIKNIFNNFNLNLNILEHSMSSLSGGEKQRILLISSILTNKKLLLWDEPTSALDLNNKKVLFSYISKMYETTILSISHDDFWIGNMQKNLKLC